MNEKLYLISDVAKRLETPVYRIAYLFMSGKLDEPYRIGNRRMFSNDDIARIRAALGKTKGDQKK